MSASLSAPVALVGALFAALAACGGAQYGTDVHRSIVSDCAPGEVIAGAMATVAAAQTVAEHESDVVDLYAESSVARRVSMDSVLDLHGSCIPAAAAESVLGATPYLRPEGVGRRTVVTGSTASEGAPVQRTIRSVAPTATRRVVRRAAPRSRDVGRGVSGNTSASWLTPVDEPRVTSRFGRRVDPITGEVGRMHRGIDYGARTGTTVRASAAGTALMAGWCSRGTGNCVVIDHGDGWRTQYFHLSSVSISAGARVRRGEKVGEIGATGRATGPHLHFQIGRYGEALDPEHYLGKPVGWSP